VPTKFDKKGRPGDPFLLGGLPVGLAFCKHPSAYFHL
jgi:hypothetical protein